MTRNTLMGRTTALAFAAGMGFAAPGQAQPFADLAGIMVQGCRDGIEAVDAGTLGKKAFRGEPEITAEMVRAGADDGEVCIGGRGRLRLRDDFNNDKNTTAETDAPADKPSPVPTAETAAKPSPVPMADTAETAAKPAPEADQPVAAPARVKKPKVLPSVLPAPAAMAETADNGRDTPVAAEADSENAPRPSVVQEMVVTEENSRSSDEDFAKPGAPRAEVSGGSGGDKGLSNLGKFAIGAAGLVALGAILNDRSEVVQNSGDRVVVRRENGDLRVLRDDDTLLRQPGSQVRTETFDDGSTRSTVTRANGSKIVTITDASGRVLRRERITQAGKRIVLIDDTEETRPVILQDLPEQRKRVIASAVGDEKALRRALRAEASGDLKRRFSLRQVRELQPVRALMPEISIESINFATGSAAIAAEEAAELFDLGQAMAQFIEENPDELFLIEGHTDAIGDPVYNLALSDRRAESVALALTEYFNVPPENMIIQGYGESELLVPTQLAERANRRAMVRRITPLLR
ncbi:MAG: OmpA family protein [Rhodobacter sp.]|nr:OmpA family protein [Rhodobacter sp.]